MFHEGEKVYHRGLKDKGTFVRYDKLDTDTAHVIFLEDGYYDTKRVSISLLEKAKDHNEVLKTSKGYISYVGFIGGENPFRPMFWLEKVVPHDFRLHVSDKAGDK